MSDYAKRLAFMAAGLAAMIFSNLYMEETLLGWAGLLAGIGFYYYGWRGVCPACRAQRCAVAPPERKDAPADGGAKGESGPDSAAAH
ncbi:hypothetical protein IYX23_02250 [Methylocystis sp. L43]|jgi:hypothetical protein|uniref:hypothetical protein n=1 Tax=unclassified Methylocystis TaxID=2625913 RepID=UPI0018C2848D|nr:MULTISPECIES: hypothetical protein [unclassified Methylocystis]MBG0796520.1 hypothetical protein [Methylocystis sp. L43]MBG0804444.1 hypothetical protein [Methylocystis sp. H15]